MFQKGSWTRFQVVTDTGEMADHVPDVAASNFAEEL